MDPSLPVFQSNEEEDASSAEQQPHWLLRVKHVVFSGGGVRATAFLGALQCLEEVHALIGQSSGDKSTVLLQQFEGFAGSSAGALLAMGCAAQVSLNDMTEWFLEQETDDTLWEAIRNVTQLTNTGGLLHGQALKSRVEQLLSMSAVLQTPATDEWTFDRLHQVTGKTLKVVTSNLSSGRYDVFDHLSTPDASVVDVVVASMSLPFLVQPSTLRGQLHVDGGLFNNFPIDLFPADDVLGLRVCGTPTLQGGFEFQRYASFLCSRTMDYYEDMRLRLLPEEEYRHRTVTVEYSEANLLDMVRSNRQTRERYVAMGHEVMKQYLVRELLLAPASVLMTILFWTRGC